MGAHDPCARTTRPTLLLSILGLSGVLGLAYLRVLFFGETFAVRDHLTWTLPSRAFLAENLRLGHLPEWWDALRLGERFAADPNNGVTYPLAWIVALGDPLFGADLVLLLHLLLAGTGTLLFARRLGASPLGAFFGAAALMTSGYMTSMIVNGSILMPLGWMPLLAWAALGVAEVEDRRDYAGRGLVFALVLAGSVASGNPAHVNNLMLAGAIVLLCARHRFPSLLALAAAGTLGLMMGAASLLPPLLTLPDSARAGGLTLAQSGAWSMHPLRLVELVWPQFWGQGLRPERSLATLWAHGGGTLEAIWSGSNYLGLPVLFCAGIATLRNKRTAYRLGLLSLFFLVLALGTFTPVYRLYRAIFWFERVLRYPEKHLAAALVLWSALAALGFDQLFDPAREQKRTMGIAIGLALALMVGLLIAHLGQGSAREIIARESLSRWIGLDADAAVAAVLEGGLAAVMVALLVPLALWLARRPRFERLVRPCFALVVLAHMVAHDWSVHVLVSRALIREKPALLVPLPNPSREVPPRLLRRVEDFTPITVSGEARAAHRHQLASQNAATRFGFDQLPGYSIAGTGRFDALVKASGIANLERIMDLLDIRYLIMRAGEAGAMGMPLASPGAFAGHVVLENTERRPRAFVAYRWKHGISDHHALDELFVARRQDVDLGAIRLSGAGDNALYAVDDPTPCKVERPSPERLALHCQARRPGYAVLLDEWTSGWTARLDDRPVTIERADVVFRAVAIPAGSHVVEMRYRTPGLRTGAAISSTGFALFCSLLGIHLIRRRRAARVV